MKFKPAWSLLCWVLLSGCVSGVENVETTVWNDFRMESFSLKAQDGTSIPVMILYPGDTGDKGSAVLLLHGITASKDTEWLIEDNFPKGGNLTLGLLKRGFIVVAIDARMHGERALKEYPDFESHFTDVTKNWNSMYDNTSRDVVTTLKYLQTRDDINGGKIGIFGFSLGTLFAFRTAAEHPDLINTVVVAVPPISRDDRSNRNVQTFSGKTSLPVLMLAGSKDEWTPLENSRWVFEGIPAADKELIVYDSTHSLPVEYTDQAVAWFDKHLNR